MAKVEYTSCNCATVWGPSRAFNHENCEVNVTSMAKQPRVRLQVDERTFIGMSIGNRFYPSSFLEVDIWANGNKLSVRDVRPANSQ